MIRLSQREEFSKSEHGAAWREMASGPVVRRAIEVALIEKLSERPDVQTDELSMIIRGAREFAVLLLNIAEKNIARQSPSAKDITKYQS